MSEFTLAESQHTNNKGDNMPQGKGTYGKKRGRPPKRKGK